MMGEPTLYRVEVCPHDEGHHPNSYRLGGHFVGSMSDNIPMCEGSKLVPADTSDLYKLCPVGKVQDNHDDCPTCSGMVFVPLDEWLL